MPQEPKPVVRIVTNVAVLLSLSPGRQYSPVQHRPTNPMFRKVAEKPPTAKKLVYALVGWLKIRTNPDSMSDRSGMKTAAIAKLLLKNKRNSFKKERSESWFSFLIPTPRSHDNTQMTNFSKGIKNRAAQQNCAALTNEISYFFTIAFSLQVAIHAPHLTHF